MKDTYKKEFNVPVSPVALVGILYNDWRGKHQTDGNQNVNISGAENKTNATARRAVRGGYNTVVISLENDSNIAAVCTLQRSTDLTTWNTVSTVTIQPRGRQGLSGTVYQDYWRVTVVSTGTPTPVTAAPGGSVRGTWIVPLEQSNIPDKMHECGCLLSCETGCEDSCETRCQLSLE